MADKRLFRLETAEGHFVTKATPVLPYENPPQTVIWGTRMFFRLWGVTYREIIPVVVETVEGK